MASRPITQGIIAAGCLAAALAGLVHERASAQAAGSYAAGRGRGGR
jgi:hypothetical protein